MRFLNHFEEVVVAVHKNEKGEKGNKIKLRYLWADLNPSVTRCVFSAHQRIHLSPDLHVSSNLAFPFET